MKKHSSLVLAFAACTALLSGCGGGGHTGTTEVSPPTTSSTERHTLSTPGPGPVQITGAGATFDSSGNMTEDGVTYPFIFKGIPRPSWVRLPWLSPSQTYLGYHGIGLEVDPTGSPLPPTDGKNDKAELTFRKGFPFQEDDWTGFAMELGLSTDVPSGNVILFQWWQGTPYGPPLSLMLEPASDYSCMFSIRNNATGGNPSAATITLPAGTCQPGVWHTFLVHTRMHYAGESGTGQLEVYHNDMTTPVIEWSGDIGYDPSQCVLVNGTGACQGGDPNPVFTSYYGPYRDNQPHTVQSFFTNIKFALDQASADPTQP